MNKWSTAAEKVYQDSLRTDSRSWSPVTGLHDQTSWTHHTQ